MVGFPASPAPDNGADRSPVGSPASPSSPPAPVDAPDDRTDSFPEECIRRWRRKHRWTHTELKALQSGMDRFGTSWANIKKTYGSTKGPLRRRSQMDLKDKARAELEFRIKNKLPRGIFALVR
ncbi:5690_t:CDS:2 [Cetraspora pellucida]|uniref:5690_t:CDS:1 n=1 Tax=Cetraspora pellucida TaxID=1433469 RepID=A0A9N9HYW2_9GLOM|nr:5690_t:CDS:2 [Cetraspora pellucida]